MLRVWSVAVALAFLAQCGGAASTSGGCVVDGECPIHQLCEPTTHQCVTGCVTNAGCGASEACDAHGRCLPANTPDLSVRAVGDDGPPDLSAVLSPDLSATVDLATTHESHVDLSVLRDLAVVPDLAVSPDLLARVDLSSLADLLTAGDLPVTPFCGDGTVQAGEQCDDGAASSDAPASAATCTTQCRRRASCGALAGSTAAKIDPATGHCYVAWPGPLNWSSALRQCEAQGGTLATLTTMAEDQLVRTLSGSTSRWIGMSSARTGTPVLTWITGEARSYGAFAPGEPNNQGNEECVLLDAARGNAWDDRTCGWPTSGNLGASPASALGFVCESSCGNGVVDPGEGCDPPGTSCTTSCQVKRTCPESGGVVSPVNGHCYFAVGPATDFAGALAGCPSGTHLATLAEPAEDEAAQLAISADTWFALRAPNLIDFAWQGVAATDFNPRLYHAFSTGEPNQTPGPVCVRVTKGTGWKDTTCAGTYVRLCERE